MPVHHGASRVGLFRQSDHADDRKILDEILRNARDVDRPSLDDETIDRIADEAFLEYDLLEASDGGS